MPNMIKEISEWGLSLPYWEQAALDKIIGRIEITDEVIEDLSRYFLEDSKLIDQLPLQESKNH